MAKRSRLLRLVYRLTGGVIGDCRRACHQRPDSIYQPAIRFVMNQAAGVSDSPQRVSLPSITRLGCSVITTKFSPVTGENSGEIKRFSRRNWQPFETALGIVACLMTVIWQFY